MAHSKIPKQNRSVVFTGFSKQALLRRLWEEARELLVLLGCCFPHCFQGTVQFLLLPLGLDVSPHPLLVELQSSLVFGDLEQHHHTYLFGDEAACLLDRVLHKLGGAWPGVHGTGMTLPHS